MVRACLTEAADEDLNGLFGHGAAPELRKVVLLRGGEAEAEAEALEATQVVAAGGDDDDGAEGEAAVAAAAAVLAAGGGGAEHSDFGEGRAAGEDDNGDAEVPG